MIATRRHHEQCDCRWLGDLYGEALRCAHCAPQEGDESRALDFEEGEA